MKTKRIILLATVALLGFALQACQKEDFIAGAAAFFSITSSGSNNPFADENDDSPEQLSGFDANGASDALFTVGYQGLYPKKVRFSRGNLQFQAITATWRFAGRQYYFVGKQNDSIGIVNEGWIDLFGWGTAGWRMSRPNTINANCYHPYDYSNMYFDYYVLNNFEQDLLGDSCRNADWGIYNSIANGGNRKDQWRTLKASEWEVLLGGTYADVRMNKNGLATIAGTYHGLIILPDEWTTPDGLSFTPGKNRGWSTNTYSEEEWVMMESAGAIFLPAAGYRIANGTQDDGSAGYYWSVNHQDMRNCNAIGFKKDEINSTNRQDRSRGLSVRLVKDF
ncbi:MAG: hypothetical protein J6Y52_06140 [Bacteroidales bacterium]|nr:hypothetical protein [Bacteroidales bacterium]